jgi:ABC-2 type transport system ATP-binding protein
MLSCRKISRPSNPALAISFMEEAERVADGIAVIDHGRIVAEGTAAALREQTGGRTLKDALTGHSIREAEAAPIDRMRMMRRVWLGRR